MASLGGSTAGAAELDPAVADALNEARRVRDAVINTDADPHTAANAELDYAAELHAHHQVREARDAYQRALQRDASLFAPHHLLGVLEASLGNNEAARMHFDAALARQPNVPATLIRRGDLLRGLGDLDAADADYRTAILLDPGAAAAHAGLGQVALQRHSFDAAVVHFKEALRLQPAATQLNTPFGLALRQAGHLDEARAALAGRGDRPVHIDDAWIDALAKLRRNPLVFFQRGQDLARQGRGEEALAQFAKAVELAPDEAEFQHDYGVQLHALGRSEEALDALQRAWALGLRSAANALLRGRILSASRDWSAAQRCFREAQQIEPDARDIRAELGRVSMRLDDFASAFDAFDSLVAGSEGAERNHARYWSGLAAAMLGRCDAAEQALSDVVTASSGRDGWALLALARLRAVCDGDPAHRAQAIQWAETMAGQFRGAETLETLAMLRAAERRRDEAVQLQNEAIASAERAGADPQLLADMRAQLARFRAGKRASAAFSPHSPMLEE